jgi:hypothetical protein
MAELSPEHQEKYTGSKGLTLLKTLGPKSLKPSSWFVMYFAQFMWGRPYGKYVGRKPEYIRKKQIGTSSPAILKVILDDCGVEEYAMLYKNVLYFVGEMPMPVNEYDWRGCKIVEIIRRKS